MAENGAGMDIRAHERSYGRFLGLLKGGIIGVAVIVVIVVLLIAR